MRRRGESSTGCRELIPSAAPSSASTPAASESIGEFTCDNELINRIHRATRWAQRSNLMGYPMDWPQRDERLGWFGDAMVSMEEAMFNFDLPLFYRQWLNGVRFNQNEANGDISIVSPRPYTSDEPDPTWSSAYVVMTWQYYLHYGDRQFLSQQFVAMKRYVDFLGTQATNHILPKYWIGDPIRSRSPKAIPHLQKFSFSDF